MKINKQQLIEIVRKHQYLSASGFLYTNWKKAKNELDEYFNRDDSQETWRSRYRHAKPLFDESNPIQKDGTYGSPKYVQLKVDGNYTADDLVRIAGLDPREFELDEKFGITKSLIGSNGEIKFLVNEHLKLRFIRKKFELTKELLQELFSMSIEPLQISREYKDSKRLLELAFTDLHFRDDVTIETYSNHLDETLRIIETMHWDKVVIPIGNDLFNVDNLNNTTTAGTQQQEMSLKTAWHNALQFYQTLINETVKYSNDIDVLYVGGNHDRGTSLLFVLMLEQLYSEVEHITFNTSEEEYKYILWNEVFLGWTHGSFISNDKSLAQTYQAMFRKVMAQADLIEIHAGHYHRASNKSEVVRYVDDQSSHYDMRVRRIGTASPNSKWSNNKGFISRKEFEIFVYTSKALKNHIFIDGQ